MSIKTQLNKINYYDNIIVVCCAKILKNESIYIKK